MIVKFYLNLLKINSFRNFIAFVDSLFYLKILRKKPKRFTDKNPAISQNTLESNLRVVHKKSDLPDHPKAKFFLGVGLNQGNPKSNMLIEPINAVLSSKIIKKKNLKVLSIGPRTLGEILNIQSYGFSYKNIYGLDLFSLNKKIEVGDMHDLPWDDNFFDIVLCGWAIAYSENKKLVANEISRVLKKDGIFSIGVSFSPSSNEEQIKKRGYLIGSDERLVTSFQIEELFDNSISKVYFRTDPENADAHSQIILTASVT